MGEKAIGLLVAFVVSIIVARYLGPEGYGSLSYVLSLTGLFGIAGHLGLSGLVVREIVKDKNGRGELLGTTCIMKFIGMSVGFVALILYAFLVEEPGSKVFYMLLIAATAMLIQPVNVIDFWFQSQVQAKYSVVARTIGLLSGGLYKLALVFGSFSLIFFAWSGVLQALISAIFFLLLYRAKSFIPLHQWKFNAVRAYKLLKQSWMVFAGAIFAVIYMKIDLVMLNLLNGPNAVGVYAVAAQLSEAWYFVPTAIVMSIFPKLITLREQNVNVFNQRLQQLFDLLFIMAVSVAIFVSLVAPWVIQVLYGDAYSDSALILAVHIWAGIFIFMRAAFSKWILIEDALMFSLVTQGCGALLNVALNLLLIPHYGALGAAVGTLLSYATASYFALVLSKKTRPVFWMMSKSMTAPFRYIFYFRTTH